jgi:hypothetical protein
MSFIVPPYVTTEGGVGCWCAAESAGGGRRGELLGGAPLEPHRTCAKRKFACDPSRGAMRCVNFYDCIEMTDEADLSGSPTNITNIPA